MDVKREICINKDGYYTTDWSAEWVEFCGEAVPDVERIELLGAYKYDRETKDLVLDEDKMAVLRKQYGIADPNTPSMEDRIAAIEGLMLDMLSMEADTNE